MLEKFSSGAQRIISLAEALAFEFNHPTVGSEHLLLSFLKCKDNLLTKELSKYNIDYLSLRDKVKNLYQGSDDTNIYVQYTFELKELLADSLKISEKNKESLISSDSLALAVLSNKNIAQELLAKEGVNINAMLKAINHSRKRKSELNTIPDLHLSGADHRDPLIGREKELRQLINALSRRNKPNAILLGEPGVGKSAIVEELAKQLLSNKIPSLKGKSIYELDIASTVSGTKYRGEFEEKIKKIIRKVQEDGNAILFIDEIHTIVKAGGAEGAIDASNILKPYLSRGEIQIIGATTEEEFNATFENDKALKRRFQIIRVEETTEEETLDILLKTKPIYEKFYSIKIDDYLLKEIVRVAKKYLLNQKFPDKAIDVLDNSCVEAKGHLTLENIYHTLENYYKVVTDYHKLETLRRELHENLIGQDEAIEAIVDEFRMIELSLEEKDAPLGVFLFNGPSGCGKTLCAKIISKCYFSTQHTLTLNMNTYRDLNGLNRLINTSSSNYLESVSPLVKCLNNCPNSLIVVDDFDKATTDIREFFFDIFDKGSFYDNRGNLINCSNAVFILNTSYVPGDYLDFKNYLSKTQNENKSEIVRKLGSSFVSRLTRIVEFRSLDPENIKTIMRQYADSHHLQYETGFIEEAFHLSDRKEYEKTGARLAYKNIKSKLIERERINNK